MGVYKSLSSVWVSDFPVLASRLETICIYSQQGFNFQKTWKLVSSAIQHLHVHMNGKKML